MSENSRDLYFFNLYRSYGKSKPHQGSTKEIASDYKKSLLNNKFPIELTDGEFIYDIIINKHGEIIFKNGIHTSYYSDVPNKLIATLKVIQPKL